MGRAIADDQVQPCAMNSGSVQAHPLALIRDKLNVHRIWTAEALRKRAKNGQMVRASGIVTHRQQPSTASGVIFATLEDETGIVDIIVWPSVAEEQRAALRGSKLFTVQGTWPSEKGVHSLVALKLRDHTDLLEGLRVSSRDFR